MNYVRKQELKRQFKVEIFKGIQIIDNESYDFIESRQFFPTAEEANVYIEKLKLKLESNWVIRYFKRSEEDWELLEIIN
ncbi:hypothetical protein [Candidatus Cetobacterium colombiensis]|uniref:Uncharacterized protein n=1 Tax=Candidatus Cetobacterium colombiensis TaxID=3073100 RepID=A0ABU4W9I1_9FUSO|nr:hypothetical protein [Candidatus Cetobacterium colombiensis]MDX8336178.1 hypothetical protein [Candidatus Cetobacterium colombiensis]